MYHWACVILGIYVKTFDIQGIHSAFNSLLFYQGMMFHHWFDWDEMLEAKAVFIQLWMAVNDSKKKWNMFWTDFLMTAAP